MNKRSDQREQNNKTVFCDICETDVKSENYCSNCERCDYCCVCSEYEECESCGDRVPQLYEVGTKPNEMYVCFECCKNETCEKCGEEVPRYSLFDGICQDCNEKSIEGGAK